MKTCHDLNSSRHRDLMPILLATKLPLALFGFLWCALAFIVHSAPLSEPTHPPHLVFIISDDHAWTDYGFMDHPHIETPHLDRLATQSALFPRGYVPTALCRPALTSLATGLYAHQHRITGNDPALLPEMLPRDGQRGLRTEPDAYRALREELIAQFDRHASLPRLLHKLGYLSHQSGKWWEGSYARAGFTHGMTRGFPQPGGRHGDDGLRIGREGMTPIFEFIDHAINAERPFFIWYAPFLPHDPHNPPDRLYQKYKAKGIPSDSVARYYAMVEWFDETCGQLLDYLDARNLASNTLVVYIGDNGWIQQPDGPGFAPRSKQSAYEGGVRQPTMFRWPGVIQPGNRGDQLCSSVDIMPTALAAAGARIPDQLPGYNLLPFLKSGESSPRQMVFGETFAHDVADIGNPEESLLYRWVIEGRWKLLLTYDGKVGRYARHHPRTEKRPQLFDLVADPHENHNLAAEHPRTVARLAAELQSWWPVTQRRATQIPALRYKDSGPTGLPVGQTDEPRPVGPTSL
jgi:arylsulfatase A-like enzyme